MGLLRPYKKHAPLIIGGVCFLIIDRFLKSFAIIRPESRELIPDWINFSLSRNTGAAFSLHFGFDLLWIVVPVLIGALYWLYSALRRQAHFEVSCLFIILLGAASNLFDRLRYGAIIDYVDVAYFSVFNLADVLILGGAAWLLYRELLSQTRD